MRPLIVWSKVHACQLSTATLREELNKGIGLFRPADEVRSPPGIESIPGHRHVVYGQVMDFTLTVTLVGFLLQREARLSFRYLQDQFGLDDQQFADLRYELVVGRRLAVEEDGARFVWCGDVDSPQTPPRTAQSSGTQARVGVSPDGHTDATSQRLSEPDGPNPVISAEAERRQLTVMFCDLVGSTALSTQMDPEDLRDVITTFQDCCREVIDHYDGFIARYMGDGMLVYFGYPQAHENDAERATRTGRDIVDAMTELNTKVGKAHGIELSVRIGVATGPVIVGDFIGEGAAEEAAVVGETPNLAARLQGVALPNQLVISSATRRLVEGLFTCEDLGLHDLKGMPAATQAWRVSGLRHETTPKLSGSPLVGRQEELGLLTRAWETGKQGRGQVVLVQGEPGVGKSRLLEAMRAQLAHEDYLWVMIRCSPYHTSSSLYPVIEHLKRVVGWQPQHDELERLAKLEAALGAQSRPLAEVVPLFAELLSVSLPEGRYPALTLTAEQQRDATLDAIVGWLLDLADTKPVLQVFEDLHWADPTTLELVELYTDQSPTVSLVNVLTYRPEFVPQWPMRSHMLPITLNRLERAEVEAFVGHLANHKVLPTEVLEHIVAKADGVPLYVEELTKTILESGLLRATGEYYAMDGALSELEIPSTLQDSLMARLDRGPMLREIAQIAAVRGREFAYSMISAVMSTDEAALRDGLRRLVDDELLFQRGRGDEARYIFKHALIQDAAYYSLLNRTRQQYHRTIAHVLETPAHAQAQPELLAYHYAAAQAWQQAANYWGQAAAQAFSRSANLEGIAYLTQGITSLTSLAQTPERDQKELEMQIQLGVTLIPVEGYSAPRTVAAFARARDLCRVTGNREHLITVDWGEYTGHMLRGELDIAQEKTLETLRMAEDGGTVTARLMAHRSIGIVGSHRGDFEHARQHLEEALALYDPDLHAELALRYGYDVRAAVLSYLPHVVLELGYPAQSQTYSREAIKTAHETEHGPTLGFALFHACIFHQRYGDLEANESLVSELLMVCEMHGLSTFAPIGAACRGHLTMDAAPCEGAMSEIETAKNSFVDAALPGVFSPWFLNLLAQSQSTLERPEESLASIELAISIAKKNNERLCLPDVLQTKAELILAGSQPDTSSAEMQLQQAIQIARDMNARLPELRAATGLARLWRTQDRAQEARALLQSSLAWFTEGFEAPALRDASNLVDELRAA